MAFQLQEFGKVVGDSFLKTLDGDTLQKFTDMGYQFKVGLSNHQRIIAIPSPKISNKRE